MADQLSDVSKESGTAPQRSAPGDETRKMAVMNAWLDDICAELGVDRELVRASTPPMLRLVGEVAHGPSRPGAPLTAFVVGLAAAGAGTDTLVPGAGPVRDAGTDAVRERIDAVSALVARWAERQP